MGKSIIKSTVVLVGYDIEGTVVYSEEMPIDDYYDGEHLWDRPGDIKLRKMVKLHGKLYDNKAHLDQEFENEYSEDTGEYIGGIAKYADGTINKDGKYEKG